MIAAAQFGAAPTGPPFADPALQAAYEAEWRKLSASSAFITQGTAQALVGSVMRSALAAGDAVKPSVVAAVRAETDKAAKKIEVMVRQAAGESAKSGVGTLLLGVFTAGLVGLTGWGIYSLTRSERLRR